MRLPALPLGAAVLAALVPFARTSAQGLASFGPIDPNNGFPTNYVDTAGLGLDLCILNSGMCVLPAGPVTLSNPGAPFPDNYAGTFPDEAFYYLADANVTTAGGGLGLLRMAIEQSFVNGLVVAGDQITFARVRIRLGNLVAGATYTITTPVGIFTQVAADAGPRGINFTVDVGLVPGVFSGALGGAIGPFLKWDADLPVVDAQGRHYIGNPNVFHTVTGSPFGTNIFRVDGPSVGGPGVNRVETNLFLLMGLESGVVVPPGAPVAAFNSAPNSGNAPLNVSFTDASTGTITARSWSFGDGATSTLQNPTHSYAAGTYSVSLTVTGPGGSNTLTKPGLIVVGAVANQLVLSSPAPGTAGINNTLTVSGASPNRVVGVYTGLLLGGSIINQGSCGGIPLGLGAPFRLAGKANANAAGVASVVVKPPAGSAGKLFHFQAIQPFSCKASNIVSDVL